MTAKPETILIVEDSAEDRELYRRLLRADQEQSYVFLEAAEGEEGLALCRSTRPDCVLLDYWLPDLDGEEFLAAITDEDGICSFPVIVLTGLGSEAIVANAMRAGAADYLSKDVVSTNSLVRSIRNGVEKHRLRTALKEHYQHLQLLYRELKEKNEEIRQFYHVVSHELKTPLTSIREFVSIVLEGLAGPLSDEQSEYLTLAKNSCDQMTLTLNDLSDAARLETGKFPFSRASHSVEKVVARAVASLAPTAAEQDIALQCSVAPEMPEAYIDARRITQVLNNLVNNALKFTPPGGSVNIDASYQPPDRILVAVRDTGRGIAPDELERIFERLYQAGKDDMEIQGGLGLGLYVCREIVRLHDGDIWVESTLGKGSTFCFTLPVYVEEAMPSESKEDF